jgi:DNA-binding NtrC family response regulator
MFFRSGINVDLSTYCIQNFVAIPTAEELLRLFKRERHEARLEADVRLEAALQALQDGQSFVDIIQTAVWQLEKGVIEQILHSTQGNKAETARILKVDYKTLYRKINRYF